MRKYVVGVIALLPLVATSFGSAVGLPSAVATDAPSRGFASSSCSPAEATAVVKRLHLSDPSVERPIFKVLCGALAGRGSQVMVASIYGPENTGMLDWAVFRLVQGEWELLMKRRQGALLTAAGSDIREAVDTYRDGDPRCCPSGGTRARIWHWNGNRFVAGLWKQVTSGEPEGRAFDSPSLNINCAMFDQRGGHYVHCQSRNLPQTVTMDALGRLAICRDRTPKVDNDCNLGDRGDGPIHRLVYGKQITVGRFQCQSLQVGVKCTVIRSGKGFLINRERVNRVGP